MNYLKCLIGLSILFSWSEITRADVHFSKKMNVRSIHEFGAKGDGKTDDTAALTKAMNTTGTTYFPAGTYVVSDSIVMGKKAWVGPKWVGQSRDKVNIVLSPSAKGFSKEKRPKPVLAFLALKKRSADMFKFDCSNMTIDTGEHIGAVGIRFHSNNNGTLESVLIKGKGVHGLDLSSGLNGPLLVKDLHVDGFKHGVHAASGPYNSQTLCNITLTNQTAYGIHNRGEALFISNVNYRGPGEFALAEGITVLVNAEAHYEGTKKDAVGVVAIGNFYGRNIKLHGFAKDIKIGKVSRDEKKNKVYTYEDPQSFGGVVEELNTKTGMLGGGGKQAPTSLRLPEPKFSQPSWPNQVDNWFLVDDFGAKPGDKVDDSKGIQAALNEAAKTGNGVVCFKANSMYYLDKDVDVPEGVSFLIGASSFLRTSKGKTPRMINFKTTTAITVRGIDRPLGPYYITANVVGDGKLSFHGFRGQLKVNSGAHVRAYDAFDRIIIDHAKASVWAWQSNPEKAQRPNLMNRSGSLWVLGLKTERKETYVETYAGGKTEILGCWLYNNLKDKPGDPMFICEESEFSAAGVGYFNYWKNKFPYTVRLILDGKDHSLTPDKLAPGFGLFSTRAKP